MKKKLALLLMCVIMCCAIVATTLVACTDDTWTFKVEGVIGYSDAIIDEVNKTVSFTVQPSINSFDLNNIKVPATLSYTVKNAAKEDVAGNTVLLNSGDNTYYMTFKGDVEVGWKKYPVDVEWTIKIMRLSLEVTLSNVEIATFETTYIIDEAFKGGKIKLTYSDESTELVDIDFSMVTGFSTSNLGTYTITITYGEYTFERIIEVVKKGIGELEEVTPTVITQIDSALDTFARLAAYIASGSTSGNKFNSYKVNFLATLNNNKAEMKSFLEYLGISDANIAGLSTITDKLSPIVKKIYAVAKEGENYEQLYTPEFVTQIQSVAKDILGMFSSSQLTLAAEKALNWAIGQSIITEAEYIKYTTPITDATINAKVLAQFNMLSNGEYKDMPLNKSEIFLCISNADNILNYLANLEPEKISTLISTVVKIITTDKLTPSNIAEIGTVNIKNTINYIGEIICEMDNTLVDTHVMINCVKKVLPFIGDYKNSVQVLDILSKTDLFETKLFKIVGEVLSNFTSDNAITFIDMYTVIYKGSNNSNINSAYGNAIHYVSRMIIPVIDKYYTTEQFNLIINELCSVSADIYNSTNGYYTVNKDELRIAISNAYNQIYNASKKETLSKAEQEELYNNVRKQISEINLMRNTVSTVKV